MVLCSALEGENRRISEIFSRLFARQCGFRDGALRFGCAQSVARWLLVGAPCALPCAEDRLALVRSLTLFGNLNPASVKLGRLTRGDFPEFPRSSRHITITGWAYPLFAGAR